MCGFLPGNSLIRILMFFLHCLTGINPCLSRCWLLKISPLQLQPAAQRLKSRRSFLRSQEEFNKFSSRVDLWKATKDQYWLKPAEELASDHKEIWAVWQSLNRLCIGTARSRGTLNKWRYLVTSAYSECGDLQTTTLLYTCPLCPTQCTLEDLMIAQQNEINVARCWVSTT